MKISVIVPVYNLENELSRCLDSILAQSYSNLELIIVDDGSQDGSRQIIEDYACRDHRIVPIFKENGGVTSARLRGIKEAAGDWIGFADGDDEIEPDMYERLLANAIKYQADISHCGYRMVFPEGRENLFYDSGCIKEQDPATAVCDLLEGTLVEPGLCNKLYHRKLFSSLADRMDESIKINEDLLMNYYLFSAAAKSVFEDWCPYHYIIRNTSASRSELNEHKMFDPIRVKEIILADVGDELKEDAQKALMNTHIYTYCGLVMEKKHDVALAKKRIRNGLKEHYAWCAFLPTRTKLLAKLIVRTPKLFGVIYPLYVHFLQKSKYS